MDRFEATARHILGDEAYDVMVEILESHSPGFVQTVLEIVTVALTEEVQIRTSIVTRPDCGHHIGHIECIRESDGKLCGRWCGACHENTDEAVRQTRILTDCVASLLQASPMIGRVERQTPGMN